MLILLYNNLAINYYSESQRAIEANTDLSRQASYATKNKILNNTAHVEDHRKSLWKHV